MVTETQIKKGAILFNELIERSSQSASFKKQLIENPIATIGEVSGRPYTLPEGKDKIIVEDQTDSSVIYFNIPTEPNLDEMELTDEQLEMVAGGFPITTIATSSKICISGGIAVGSYLLGRFG